MKIELKLFTYPIILLGILISGVAAVVPLPTTHSNGFHLLFGVLAAGALPYVVLWLMSSTLSGWRLLLPGLLVLLVDLIGKVPARLFDYDGYDKWIYLTPMLATLLLLPAGYFLGRLMDGRSSGESTTSSEGGSSAAAEGDAAAA